MLLVGVAAVICYICVFVALIVSGLQSIKEGMTDETLIDFVRFALVVYGVFSIIAVVLLPLHWFGVIHPFGS